LIEAKWGKFYQEPSPEMEDQDQESIHCVVDDGNIASEDIESRDQGLD
jgi:hypothetical protein